MINEKIRLSLLKNTDGLSDIMIKSLNRINENPKRPLGKFNPWAWWVEITRGCNLRCDFCPVRLFKKDEIHFMNEETWVVLIKTINEVSPHTRLELCNAGEPTLHPRFIEFIRIARDLAPHLQILTYTNGTMLTSGKLKYKDLFDAGLNMLFVDMYAPIEVHKKLAMDSGAFWFYQDAKPENAPNIFEYQNDPDIHVIMLAENPYNWSKRKIGRGYLQTFFNDLDWPAASKFGLKPVINPPMRRCDLPMKFINVNFDGTFVFCCFDYMRHTVNKFGNIKNGQKDFIKFWFGKYMQETRKLLYYKDRSGHEFCSKCKFTSIRCDMPHWPPDLFEFAWNGSSFEKIDPVIDYTIDEQIRMKKRGNQIEINFKDDHES